MKKTNLLVNIFVILITALAMFFNVDLQANAQTDQDWSPPVNLSNSGASTDPIIIVDTVGAIHVIWVDEFDGYKYVTSTDGVNWSAPTSVKFPFLPEDTPPRLEVTSNGIIHVFWRDDENTLYYAQSLQANFGVPTSWRSQARLGDAIADFDVAIDTEDGIHVSYITNESSDNGVAGVYSRRSQDSGLSWQGSQRLFESPYFRLLTAENAHIRVAVSDNADTGNVYVAWDNPALKRIFMSVSYDLGNSWGESYEVVSPDEKSGYETPYNAEIDIVGNNILLMWQTGQSGTRCVYNSRWSEDGGIKWGETTELFGDLGICPVRIGFNVVNDEYSVMLYKVQDNLAISAWNGNQWSDMQIQNELSVFQNPVTLEQIPFGCQHISVQNDMLFVVGCGEGVSKDIWYTSRVLGSLDSWFPPPSAWSLPLVVTRAPYTISSVSSINDDGNNIHTVWVNSSISESGEPDHAIYYAAWNKLEWSRPIPIIIHLNGSPNQLFLSNDNQGRLLLVWVDETNKSLMFSWANSSRANISLEWSSPAVLPVPDKLVSSPSILIDGAGTIVVVYSVPFNEGRGVYMIRSVDFGESWSEPSRIFNAESAGWDSVNQPRITITEDGKLHSLFSRFSILEEIQSIGLYYSQSDDGGITWSDPTEISDGDISWSNIIAYDSQTLHLFWQEKNGEEITVYNRVSTDNGQTWNGPIAVSSTDNKLVMAASTMDVGGQLHLLQITSDKTLNIQEWMWNDSLWNMQEITGLLKDLDVINIQTFSAGVTHDDFLYAITFIEAVDSSGNPDNRLISIGRFVDVTAPRQMPDPAILPTPGPLLISTGIPDSQITPTASLLVETSDTPSAVNKNVVGIVILGVVMVLLIIIIRPTRSNTRN